MTAQVLLTSVVSDELVVVLKALSSEQRRQVFDFAEFLAGRRDESISRELARSRDEEASVTSMPPRTFGLHAGQAIMSDDFDDPMPDEFWFGDNDPLITKDEPVAEFNQ